jgi:hypothetical protein
MTWKIVKETTGRVQSTDIIKEINTEPGKITDEQEIADTFNTVLLNIAGNVQNHIDVQKVLQLLHPKDKDITIEMKVIPVTEVEVINIITSLKSKNPSGFDEICSNILKYCGNIISKPLMFIFNSSLASRTFPDRCKYAIVWPVYKNGDITKITNYRAISLLISFSKILETFMFNRLNPYLKVNRILVLEQFGYRKESPLKRPFSP